VGLWLKLIVISKVKFVGGGGRKERSDVADALLFLNPTAPSITVGKRSGTIVSATTFRQRGRAKELL